MSNNDSHLNTVLGTTSTAAAAYDHHERQSSSIVDGTKNNKASSVVIMSGRTPTEGTGSSSIPIEKQVASVDEKLLSGRECFVQKGGETAAGSDEEAPAVSSCEREVGNSHTDMINRRIRNITNNYSECDSSGTIASTDYEYSCNLEDMEGGGSSSSTAAAHHEAEEEEEEEAKEVSLQVVRKTTTESEAAGGDYDDHHDNNACCDDPHEPPHDDYNYNYDDEGCKTPTALDYRIPEIRPCPPPPRKSMAAVINDRSCAIGTTSSNGKLCSSAHQHHHPPHHGGRLLLDFSKEVESMFPPIVKVNLGRKMKKARTA